MSLLLALLACASEPSASDAPPAMVFEQLSYDFVVDWAGQAWAGPPRVFGTDLGYEVAVERLALRTTRVSLIECADTGLASRWSLIPAAYAAHPVTEPDVSELAPELLEELVQGDASLVGPAPSSGSVYCDLYVVMGPTEGPSVQMEGWYRAPGAEEMVAFEASTSLAISARLALDEGRWIEDAGDDDARVTLTRLPARAFDALELDTLSGEELAYEVGRALVTGAEVEYGLVR